eukprot:1155968-Pelagomonas_calceolata.AAC.10
MAASGAMCQKKQGLPTLGNYFKSACCPPDHAALKNPFVPGMPAAHAQRRLQSELEAKDAQISELQSQKREIFDKMVQ